MSDRNLVLDRLIKRASEKGYLLDEEISHEADQAGFDITDYDWLTKSLIIRNIKIFDGEAEAINKLQSSKQQDDNGDLAHIDYEPVYAKILQYVPDLKTFIDDVKNITPARFSEYSYLLQKLRQGVSKAENRKIRNRIIETHIRVAVKLGLEFYEKNPESDLEDDIEIACEGLCKAVYNLDPSSEFKTISGIASFGIFRALQRYASVNPAPYYPVHIIEKTAPIRKDLKLYLRSGLFHDAVMYAQDKIECDENDAVRFVNIFAGYVPLDEEEFIPVTHYQADHFDDSEVEYVDSAFLVNAQYDQIEIDETKEKIEYFLSQLSDSEREVIYWRYGFKDGFEYTLEAVGQKRGVTRERVRQIEKKALTKLRKKMHIDKVVSEIK